MERIQSKKTYIVWYSNYVAFCKRQNYGHSKNISPCEVCVCVCVRGAGNEWAEHRGFGGQERFSNAAVKDLCDDTFVQTLEWTTSRMS